jgi:hypothetical protein
MKPIPTINSSRKKVRKGKNFSPLIVLKLILVLVVVGNECRQLLINDDWAVRFVTPVDARHDQTSSYHGRENTISRTGGRSFDNELDECIPSNVPTVAINKTAPRRLFLKEWNSKTVSKKRSATFRDTLGIRQNFSPRTRRESLAIATQVLGGADNENGGVSVTILNEDSPNELLVEESSLPNVLKDSIQQQASQSWMLAQQIFSRVGPSFLAIISLLGYNNDMDGISFFQLYTMSLLGASCGFYIFLYFISLGYALGVTIPIVAALFVYQVSDIVNPRVMCIDKTKKLCFHYINR